MYNVELYTYNHNYEREHEISCQEIGSEEYSIIALFSLRACFKGDSGKS